ncbi:hypothetical protein GQ464_010025 [Rhodocaloribacter litoris]|uniref:hypothetical protein n=1 Tax=Rhodocaloribacter litoris TaxID=2558931 RepID=UPI00141FD3F6|nr:hypothetical protein [Rhodocaloribacter litoris]QXD13809.1 hypothetical protein GQ464_010025 [Rhodocaloribacter litoris]
MSRFFRLLLISAAFTGGLALALHYTRRRPTPHPATAPAPDAPPQSLQVEADDLPETEREALLRELAGQL